MQTWCPLQSSLQPQLQGEFKILVAGAPAWNSAMCEILNENFEEKLPEIINAIKKASFIAIDTEFTGLELSLQEDKVSLFDSPKQRYDKLRKNASNFTICQIGISAFGNDDKKSRYHAHTYNFYICPRSRGIIDSLFSCQASSFEFLAHHNFDFNKWAYKGLPFLRYDQENNLQERLKNKSLFSSIKRSMDDYVVQSCCSQVAEWLSSSPKDGDELVLTVEPVVSDYIIHKEMRLRYAELWTYCNNNDKVIVKKISAAERQHLESLEDDLDERLIDSFLGFTRVFKALVRYKKPLVGHNLLTDLLLMYNSFYKPLPKSYDTFKCEITDLFPRIYDTKHIGTCLRKILTQSDIFNSTILKELYDAMASHQGRFQVLYSPEIHHAEGFDRYASSMPVHEAGYDAYLAGYTFLRMAHMYAFNNKLPEKQHTLPFIKYLTAMEPFMNNVNLIRANLTYLNLGSCDPKASRPNWLVIESKSGQLIDTSEVIDVCSQFGSVDVKLLDPHRALVAAMNFITAREIIKAYMRVNDVRISRYSTIRHSKMCRTYLWASAILASVIGTGLLIAVGRDARS